MTDELSAVIAALKDGAVVAIPTDTVYGLACDPDNAAAVDRIYELKGRPGGLELPLLGATTDSFEGITLLPKIAIDLAVTFWPGALSIIVPVGERRLAVPRQGTSLSIRVPAHPLVRRLLEATGPLATTSANRHGEPAAATADEVVAIFGAQVPVVLDGGRGGGQASSIIDCTVVPPRLLREGPVTASELSPFLGPPLRGESDE